MSLDDDRDRVAQLLTCRTCIGPAEGTSAAELKKDVAPLYRHRLKGTAWSALWIAALSQAQDAGWIATRPPSRGKSQGTGGGPRRPQKPTKPTAQLYVATASGKALALKLIGIKTFRNWNWDAVESRLIETSLGLPSNARSHLLHSEGGLAAAVVNIHSRLGLDPRAKPTDVYARLAWAALAQLDPAVLARFRGKKFTMDAVENLVLATVAGTRVDRKQPSKDTLALLAAKAVGSADPSPAGLRRALLAALVDGRPPIVVHAPGVQASAPSSQPKRAPDLPPSGEGTDFDLAVFSRAVNKASRACLPWAERTDEVFISDVWDALPPRTRAEVGGLERFKLRLIEAHRRGSVRLSEANLLSAMDSEILRASATHHFGATFHFVRRPDEGQERRVS